MFGPSFGQQSSYNYFPNNGDYNTWGSQQINSASSGGQSRKGQYDEYYRGHGSYQGGQDGIKVGLLFSYLRGSECDIWHICFVEYGTRYARAQY